MGQTPDARLRGLERRTHRAYWGDGLVDLLAGASLVVIGMSWIFGLAALGGLAPAVFLPLWKPLRRRFTEPRLGYVELADARQDRTRRFVRMTLVAGVLSLSLGIVAYLSVAAWPTLMHVVVPALPAGLLGILAVATAEGLDLPRFFAYGGALIVAGACIPWLNVNPGWAMLAGGLVMLVGGAVLVRRLVARHRQVEPHCG